MEGLTRSALLTDLRQRVFASGAASRGTDRIGAEVELIPLHLDTGAPIPLNAPHGPALLPLLRQYASGAGWTEEPTSCGAPRFRVPGSGTLFFEPGGQLEYSSAPYPSASALLASLRRVLLPLIERARGEGIDLLAAGIDPCNPLERVPLQLAGERYSRMAAYFARRGVAGGRMMRQTAAFQLNFDFGTEPMPRWRVLNAAAPVLLAIFANSPLYAGRATGHRSFRAACWRELDPTRTGLLACVDDPAAEYLHFALGAVAMLKCPPEGEGYLNFGEWLARGQVTGDDWHTHLSTLFPEVRPKGYLELRSLDAMAPEWWAAPIALVGGMLLHAPSLRAAADLLGVPDDRLLRVAGEQGLAEPTLTRFAADLAEIGLAGATALGEEFIHGEDLEAACDFRQRFTRRHRAPADDLLPPRAEPAPTAAEPSGSDQ